MHKLTRNRWQTEIMRKWHRRDYDFMFDIYIIKTADRSSEAFSTHKHCCVLASVFGVLQWRSKEPYTEYCFVFYELLSSWIYIRVLYSLYLQIFTALSLTKSKLILISFKSIIIPFGVKNFLNVFFVKHVLHIKHLPMNVYLHKIKFLYFLLT